MFVAGEWCDRDRARTEIRDPFNGDLVDTVPVATQADVERALQAAVIGAREMRELPGHQRAQILGTAADLIATRAEALATIITREEGKPFTESLGEVKRVPALLRLCAFEGTQVRGETLPLDAHAGGEGKLGFAVRVPAGVVVAITPFNYPMLLVVHKIGPALAAGNAVILKPAGATPLTALALTAILLEAGLPVNALQCLTGPGRAIGGALAADHRVRRVTFTGSALVGAELARLAGAKRLSLELGANCPMVVLRDADLDAAAASAAIGGYINAGQVCISVQRVIVEGPIMADFADALTARVGALRVGDPMDPETKLAAMISETEAARVDEWVREATNQGARVLVGGSREGAVMFPTVVADVRTDMRMAREELFGPAVALMRAESFDEAVELANNNGYGLGAGLFTSDLQAALRFAVRVEAGSVMINSSPLWRADLMPYGGLKRSGYGREGPRYAVEEMTELKTIVFHGAN